MMGRLKRDQGQFFYSFCLDEVVPNDHRVRKIADVLDLSWVHAQLACCGGAGTSGLTGVIEVELANGSRMRITGEVDPATLTTTIATLAGGGRRR
jgi:hypothetical protein